MFKTMLAGLAILLLCSSPALALNSWKVCDLAGDVFLTRGANRIPAVIGMDIASEDIMTIKDGAWIEVVSKGKCEVWELKGFGEYSYTEHDVLDHQGDKVAPAHRLSVCFNPASFSVGKAQRIGGVIERGGSVEDELSGSGSNAALINLIIFHALIRENIEEARPYYDALRERAPGSEFVGSVAGLFERKAP